MIVHTTYEGLDLASSTTTDVFGEAPGLGDCRANLLENHQSDPISLLCWVTIATTASVIIFLEWSMSHCSEGGVGWYLSASAFNMLRLST